MAFPATHAKRDAIVLQTTRGFASAPNSPRVFLQPRNRLTNGPPTANNKSNDPIQLINMADKPGCPSVEEMVQRISALFPTAREYDVRQLLTKYHYREAVVVSALQVLKYPLTMPGPSGWSNPMATPPTIARYLPTQYVPPPPYQHGTAAHAWSDATSDGRTSKMGTLSTYSNTPMHSPTPARPNHSPKIKLKYLKSVFPKAEETFLLDLLVGSDNNVNQVTQQLLTLGHEKKDKPAPLTPRRCFQTPPPPPEPKNTVQEREEAIKLIPPPEEIARSIAGLKILFPEEDETVIEMALESTDFDFGKAKIILTNTLKQDEISQPVKSVTFSLKPTITMYSLKSSPSVMSNFKDLAGLYSPMKELSPDDVGFRIKPRHTAVINMEENALCKGPDNANLCDSYITPNGPQHGLAKGPSNATLYSSHEKGGISTSKTVNRVTVMGPNPSNRQGPKVEARGSLSKFFVNKLRRDIARRI